MVCPGVGMRRTCSLKAKSLLTIWARLARPSRAAVRGRTPRRPHRHYRLLRHPRGFDAFFQFADFIGRIVQLAELLLNSLHLLEVGGWMGPFIACIGVAVALFLAFLIVVALSLYRRPR